MLSYYTVPWSLHCLKGEERLREAKVPFEKIELIERAVFAAVPRDLGFYRLPVLAGDNVHCEGLEAIEAFISDWNNGRECSASDSTVRTKL